MALQYARSRTILRRLRRQQRQNDPDRQEKKNAKRLGISPEEQRKALDRLHRYLKLAEGSEAEALWRRESEEDYKFYAGDQDTDEVKQRLRELNRPNTTWNEIKPKIDMLIGLSRQVETDMTLVPVGVEDESLAEICNGVLKHYRQRLRLSRLENECFAHTVKSGRSYIYYYIDPSNPFHPEIKAERLDGAACYTDPACTDYDVSKGRFFFREKWLPEEEAQVYWPHLTLNEIKGFSLNYIDLPNYYDITAERIRVVEGWFKKFEEVFWFINPISGTEEWLRTEDFMEYNHGLMEGISLPNGETLQLPNGVEAVRSYRNNIYYAMFCGDNLLEYDLSPYHHDRFPVVPFGAYKDDVNNRWFSAITMMKDPQRGTNTIRRQLTHLLQTAPRGILMHETGSILNIEDYEQRGADPTYHMETAQGAVSSGKIRFSQQPQISPIFQYLDATNTQGMKDTSGVQDQLLGIQTSSREPGITAQMRQESGYVVLFLLFDNLAESRRISAEILFSMIQQFVTDETVIRVEGEKGQNLMAVNSQLNPQVSGWNDITAGKFDVEVAEDTESVTTRLATLRMLTEFGMNNPGSIPPDVLLEYTNLPYSTKQRIREYNEMMAKQEEERFLLELAAKSAKPKQATQGGSNG